MAASANEGEEAVAEPAGSERLKKERAVEQTQSPAALPLAPRPANPEPRVAPDGAQPDAGAEVVRLDRFRKK